MLRLVISLCLLGSSLPLAAQETEEAKDHETVVVTDTGGERAGAAQPELGEAERMIVERTNAFRKAEGREPVAVDDKLTEAARRFARYMAETGRYGHRANGETPAQRAAAAGYEYCSVRENIAYAFRSDGFSTEKLADQFVVGWKESPGHRRNMLARYATETGVAVAKSETTDVYFAVQLFARPRSMSIEFEVSNESDLTVTYRIADRAFPLRPRVIRTHTACRPQTVTFLPAEGTADASDPPAPVETLRLSGGERLKVVADGEGYRVTGGEGDAAHP